MSTDLGEVVATPSRSASVVLAASTVAFAACFAVWVMYGVLITYVVGEGLFAFSRVEVGVLAGTPIFVGSWLGLAGGMLAERYGGRVVFAQVMLVAAVACFVTSMADGFAGFLLCGLGLGVAGASFAVGVEYVSRWYPAARRGTALGIFGAGMLGAGFTTLLGPRALDALVAGYGFDLGWRLLPRAYGGVLLLVLAAFWLLTEPAPAGEERPATAAEQLRALADWRVWRFGLYYFALFGGFLSLSQMLPPYLIELYGVDLVAAGTLTALFIVPCGLARAVGGWLSDRYGARSLMYTVLVGTAVIAAFLTFPPMVVQTSGNGVIAERGGEVTAVTPTAVEVVGRPYALVPPSGDEPDLARLGALPRTQFHQEAVVHPGDRVYRGQLLARGVTRVYFRAHLGVFAVLVTLLGVLMGLGSAAVYKHLPDYFPDRVGTVGGLVSVAGGMGGFTGPIVFGWLVVQTGVWTVGWLPLVGLCLWSLVWMHLVIRRMQRRRPPAEAPSWFEAPAA